MPYPKWFSWDNIDRGMHVPTKHFRGKDGFPVCGVWGGAHDFKPSEEALASSTTDDPHQVNCGRCINTHALYEVS